MAGGAASGGLEEPQPFLFGCRQCGGVAILEPVKRRFPGDQGRLIRLECEPPEEREIVFGLGELGGVGSLADTSGQHRTLGIHQPIRFP